MKRLEISTAIRIFRLNNLVVMISESVNNKFFCLFFEKSKRKLSGKTEVIVCKQSRLNHYKGQTYSQFQPIPLASTGWLNNRSAANRDNFTVNSIHGVK